MKHDTVEQLFKTYYNDLLLYALTLTKEKASAEDLVADAFFKALDVSDGKVSNFKAWLFKVCRNAFLDGVRRSKKQVQLSDEIADEREAVIDKVIADESYQALYRAVEMLGAKQREVVTLFYFEDMPLKDIANIIGESADYAKLLLFRGRESIKKIMEVHNGF